ncbi:MAG: amino acid decarboxylase [Bacillota bacterium]
MKSRCTTPIVDFVKAYASQNPHRFHMPAHKGKPHLGFEPLDITEIDGADDLYHPSGIIKESERNASDLFGSGATYFSTEGSSQSIKTMISLAFSQQRNVVKSKKILCSSNCHQSFFHACALLNLDPIFIEGIQLYFAQATVTPKNVAKALAQYRSDPPFAVYITTPDYLGTLYDIKGIAEECDVLGLPLLVDNAHGSYLQFLEKSLHPLRLGATMCCDSAHKTLPTITGGAYLHIAKGYEIDEKIVKSTMAIFGSSSPSYLILQSLDYCNYLLSTSYPQKLQSYVDIVAEIEHRLTQAGIICLPCEPMKLVVDCRKTGIDGLDFAEKLKEFCIFPEMTDRFFTVFMFSPDLSTETLGSYPQNVVTAVDNSMKLTDFSAPPILGKRVFHCSLREAFLSKKKICSVQNALGEISGSTVISCPPGVPILIAGEVVSEGHLALLAYYKKEYLEILDLP